MSVTAAQIEALQKRHRTLEQERLQLQTKRDLAQERLREIQAAAKEQYGVSSLEELRELRQRWDAENSENLAQFEKNLEQLEQQLQSFRAGTEARAS